MNNIANREKLKMQTPNKTDENIQEIAKLFPHVMSEKNGKRVVDFDLLRQALSGDLVEADDERYRLDWVGKKASLLKANTPITKTLRPCKEDSVDFENTQNLYIEGDNFEVLKLIQESYLNKIKMIYIDPPYNTGKDFVYRDNFTKSKAEHESDMGLRDEDENKLFKNTDSNGRFHSDWLSMMYERLLVSRDLLKEDGVIFISIDDNEVHNLRKICDEVFGEGNFVDVLKWKRKKQPSFLAKHTSKIMEYILIYSKDKSYLEKLSIEGTSDSTKKVINISNNESTRHFSKNVRIKLNGKGIIKSGIYKIKTMTIEYKQDIHYEDGKTLNECDVIARFSVSQEKINEYIEEELLFITINNGLRRDVSEEEIGKRKSITDLLLQDWGDNQESDNELRNIFETTEYFDYTKPTVLIKNLTKSIFSEENIILDFFSGSATTAHAVMQLNAEDGGNRKYICVQLQEETDEKSEAYKAGYKTICEIGKERIRRAGEKILNDKLLMLNEEENSKLDIGFRVLKIDTTNFKEVYYHPNELGQKDLFDMQSNIKEDRTDLDLLFQTMLDLGVELSLKITPKVVDGATIYMLENNELVACFADDVSLHVIEEIKSLAPYQIVLKDSCFSHDKDKINAVESLSKVSTVSVI